MFKNREEAGILLAKKLKREKISNDAIVIAIPRGGVVVADVVAKELHIPLSLVVVKKIGSPGNPELAIGAVAPEGTVFWDEKLMKTLPVGEQEKEKLLEEKKRERETKEQLFHVQPSVMNGKYVVVVDDGVATGATVIAASLFLRRKGALQIVLAVPVIAKDTLSYIKKYVNKVVYLEAPLRFYAVGEFYEEFPEIKDENVLEILRSQKTIFS